MPCTCTADTHIMHQLLSRGFYQLIFLQIDCLCLLPYFNLSSIKGCYIEFCWQVSTRCTEKYTACKTLGAVFLILSVNRLFRYDLLLSVFSRHRNSSLSHFHTLLPNMSLTAEIKQVLLLPLGFRWPSSSIKKFWNLPASAIMLLFIEKCTAACWM